MNLDERPSWYLGPRTPGNLEVEVRVPRLSSDPLVQLQQRAEVLCELDDDRPVALPADPVAQLAERRRVLAEIDAEDALEVLAVPLSDDLDTQLAQRRATLRALGVEFPSAPISKRGAKGQPQLVRARQGKDAVDVEGRTLVGHAARFNEWTVINEFGERFLERIAPGAFKKTIAERGDRVKIQFDHGHHPSIGSLPLGTIRHLVEDPQGLRYEVDLLDVDYVNQLVPGLREGLYGASFRMQVIHEAVVEKPARSIHNPDRLAERTIKEVRLYELGPVVWPAYENASAGLRSLTDDYAAAA